MLVGGKGDALSLPGDFCFGRWEAFSFLNKNHTTVFFFFLFLFLFCGILVFSLSFFSWLRCVQIVPVLGRGSE